MCTYSTEHVQLAGSAKGGPGGWRGLGSTTVYFDHPVHAPALHTLNIDFGDPAGEPSGRIALELNAAKRPLDRRDQLTRRLGGPAGAWRRSARAAGLSRR